MLCVVQRPEKRKGVHRRLDAIDVKLSSIVVSGVWDLEGLSPLLFQCL
jgi:hypothetical protein